MCCRLVFQHKSTSVLGKFSESANQEFKDYRWPLENESIKFHLTKTVVGFLNTTGGIIYVGLREDKSKIIEVKGIKLSQQ
jgi:predicted HTH transcriptional regulator